MDKSCPESNVMEQMGYLSDSSTSNMSRRQKRGREQHDFEEDFKTFKEEMKSMITSLLSAQQSELKKICCTQVEIKETNTNIESSLSFVTEQNEKLKKQIEKLELRATKDREYIGLLEEKIEDLQRANRKTNLEKKKYAEYWVYSAYFFFLN